MTQPRTPDYEKFVSGLDALRAFAEGMAKATAVRNAWRLAFSDELEPLQASVKGLDRKTLTDLLVACRRLETAVKREYQDREKDTEL